MRSPLGECLVQAGVIGARDLAAAIAEHRRSGDRLGAVLVRLRLATEAQIADALASQLGFPYVDLAEDPPDPGVVPHISRALALRAVCVAVRIEDDALVVAMADPLLFSLVQDLEAQTGRRVREVVATETGILAAIDAYYPVEREGHGGTSNQREGFSEASNEREGFGHAEDSAAAVVQQILALAAEMDSADVHIEPTADALVIRDRRDGVLLPALTRPIELHEEVVARMKLMAGLDVSEKLLPQAGKIAVGADQPVTLRVATLRTARGEKVVLRPIDRHRPAPPLDDLGLSPTAIAGLREAIRRSTGIVIVAGPRGSGRSTTLAAILTELASGGRAVIALEQTIEYDEPSVTRIPVDGSLDLSIAKALRAALEQRPDVVAIDELADREAADAAAAAAVGRLVIAVVTADDSADALRRTADLVSVQSQLLPSVRAVLAQRLVRRLCTSCRREHVLTRDDLVTLHLASADVLSAPVFEPAGCDECDFTGYRGRIGIFEILRVTEAVRQMVQGYASAEELRGAEKLRAMVTLADEARGRLETGTTSITELRRAVGDFREARSICVQCGTALSPDFTACPHCGTPVGGSCPHCGRALQRGWNFCPFCARPGGQGGRPSKRGIMRLVRNSDSSDPV